MATITTINRLENRIQIIVDVSGVKNEIIIKKYREKVDTGNIRLDLSTRGGDPPGCLCFFLYGGISLPYAGYNELFVPDIDVEWDIIHINTENKKKIYTIRPGEWDTEYCEISQLDIHSFLLPGLNTWSDM